jgi:hypothetical protein
MGKPLEHAEHISHANHGHGDEHGPEGDHAAHAKLGTHIGITMAVLGVILAYCAAKVGAERTELIQALVEQQHAHAKYQAQDIKHRVAVSNLRQLHAVIPPAELAERLDADLKKIDDDAAAPPAAPPKAEGPAAKPEAAAPKADAASVTATTRAARALGHNLTEIVTPNKKDAALLAGTVDRYKTEAEAATHWVDAFNPAIRAHSAAQERFELAQLLAEIGIVIASVALLVKRRLPWFGSLVLGAASLVYVATTLAGTGHVVHEAEAKIEEKGKEYRDLRSSHKATEADDVLVAEVRKWAGVSAPPAAAPAHHAPAHQAPAKHHE